MRAKTDEELVELFKEEKVVEEIILAWSLGYIQLTGLDGIPFMIDRRSKVPRKIPSAIHGRDYLSVLARYIAIKRIKVIMQTDLWKALE